VRSRLSAADARKRLRCLNGHRLRILTARNGPARSREVVNSLTNVYAIAVFAASAAMPDSKRNSRVSESQGKSIAASQILRRSVRRDSFYKSQEICALNLRRGQ
jgi:hypothetical protein